MSNTNVLKVRVRTATDIIFEGEIERVTSFNEVGQFDVFPMHANFISIIRQEINLYHKKEKVKELKIEQAVMKVKKDTVHIFLGIEAFSLEEERVTSDQFPTHKKIS